MNPPLKKGDGGGFDDSSKSNAGAILATPLVSLICLFLTLSLLPACKREERRFSDIAPSSVRYQSQPMSELQPGGPGAPAAEPAAPMRAALKKGPYDDSAWAVSEGKRLYQWYNCVGCHAHGGGGMGPALMDEKWIYGSEPENIYDTIVQGRPNGMPAFGGKIPDAQVWQLVAYVRSMSGLLPKDIRPTRSDHMSVRPSEQSMKPEKPTGGGTAPPGVEMPQ